MRPGDAHPALVLAVSRLLRPLVRVLIAQGFTFPALSRLLKEVYVDVAEADFELEGKPQTDSRINLLTGIHRKDIRTLRQRQRTQQQASPVVSRNAHMIALWTGAPDYLDERGRPRPLPRLKATDGGPSFETLVDSVSKDIRARAVLDEWMRLDLVRLDEQDQVHLNSEAFVPREDFADLAFYFGRNLRDHIAAGGHNLLGGEPPMLERAVYYEGLTLESVRELSDFAREAGSEALLEVNRKAFELAERDKQAADAEQRMTFGVFFFSGEETGDEDGD